MKRTYQIAEAKAIAKFQSHLANDPGAIQLVVPLAEVAQQLRQGVNQLLFGAELRLLELIMEDEVAWLTWKRYARGGGERQRWGQASGSVVIHGQKVPICRPRVRTSQGDLKLGTLTESGIKQAEAFQAMAAYYSRRAAGEGPLRRASIVMSD